MKNLKLIFNILQLILFISGSKLYASEHDPKPPKTMAVVLEGANSFFWPFAGGGYGAGLRFELAFSRFVSLIIPLEYRFLAMSGFDESNKFQIGTAGLGARFYFSQFFCPEEIMRGFFLEAKAQAGYAHQKSGMPKNYNNKGTTFALGAALGYNYVFDSGLVLSTSLGMTARSYLRPIIAPTLIHPIPELILGIGWAF